jgi:DNA-binding PadR family transcriptional regulator
VRFDSPRAALARGIATVHQDLALIPLLSVWRNFHLGAEPARGVGPFRRIDVRLARQSTLEALASFGIRLSDAERPVGTLSGGERQSIAIARAVHRGARVLILGVFMREDRPLHGYEIRQTLEMWGADHWANIAYGSIYHALAKMSSEGLLDEAGTDSSGRGPARKLYALTAQGREEFLTMLRDHWWRYTMPVDRMSVAMTFMDFLARDEVLAALSRRAVGFRHALEEYPEWIRVKREFAGEHVAESLRRSQMKDEAELRWLEDVIALAQ